MASRTAASPRRLSDNRSFHRTQIESNKIVDDQCPNSHGTSGPLEVSHGGHRTRIGEEFVASTIEHEKVPFHNDIQDFNTGHGVTWWARWISKTTGRRQDAAHGYVHPVLKTQSNLHLLCEARTVRCLFADELEEDGSRRAIGVEYTHNPYARKRVDAGPKEEVGEVRTLRARKMVVICAGALATPGVLERSGVGSAEVLKAAGIEQVVDLPVGNTYHDHQLVMGCYVVEKGSDTNDEYLRGNPGEWDWPSLPGARLTD